jgi:hypothetical protein
MGRCRPVGVFRSDPPTFDAIEYDRPNPPRGWRATAIAVAGGLRDQVRIEFLRIVRNPLPPFVPQSEQERDPDSGQFTVFLNGVEHLFRPQGLVVPGGPVPINFCTVERFRRRLVGEWSAPRPFQPT